MTLPANIRINTQVPFPAMVQGSGPIGITKANGIWTVSFAVTSFGIQNPPPLSAWATDYMLVYDSIAGQFIRVPLGSILWATGRQRFVAVGVNFNSGNTDTQIPIVLPPGISRYAVESVRISNASQTLSTATAGLFTAAAGGGVAIVTAASTITVTAAGANANNNTQAMTVNNANTEAYNSATLFFRVANAQGAPATGDVIITVIPLS